MNLSTDIKFSGNLIVSEKCQIIYSGFLFKNNSESVTIVYGFNDEWKNTAEQEMKKTENGFVSEISIQNFDNLNFCFRNSNYEWDNNNNQNYCAPISKISENFIINEGIIDNLMQKISEYDISEITAELNEETEKIETIDSKIMEETISNNEFENTANIESFEVSVKHFEPVNIEESRATVTEENDLNDDLEQLYNELHNQNFSNEKSQETISKELVENADFNMDSLINEILAPITDSDNLVKEDFEVSKAEDFSSELQFADTIKDLENDNEVNTLIDNLISDLYKNTSARTEKAIQNDCVESETLNNQETILKQTSKETTNVFFEKNEMDQLLEKIKKIDFSDFFEDESNIKETKKETISDNVEENIFEEEQEASLLDNLETDNSSTALVEVDNLDNYIVSARSLRKFYFFKKKVKLAFYKILSLPKIILSNFTEKNNN